MYAKLQQYKILNQTASRLTGATSHTVRRSFVTWRGYNVKFVENSLVDFADARTWGSKCVLHLQKKFHLRIGSLWMALVNELLLLVVEVSQRM